MTIAPSKCVNFNNSDLAMSKVVNSVDSATQQNSAEDLGVKRVESQEVTINLKKMKLTK